MAIALDNGTIRRLNLKEPEEIQTIEMPRKDQIHKLFMDPNGNHLLITMENEDNYYLHQKSRKPKALGSKMKGVIEACAWDRSGISNATMANVLVGTRNGQIYELLIDSKETTLLSLTGTKERSKLLFVLPEQSITGIACETFPFGETKHFVMVTTPSRIYQFIGSPTYETLFQHYEKPQLLRLTELPGTSTGELQLFSLKGTGLANAFAWLSGAGLFHGDIIFGAQKEGDTMSEKQELTSYPDPAIPPIGFILTEFHYLLLYSDRFLALSRIDDSITFTHDFTDKIRLIGFAQDPTLGIIFCYSATKVWEVIIKDEDKNVWDKYLQKNMFDLALQYAKRPAHKDKVHIRRSEHYFENKQYSVAAQFYAKTSKSFEEITLKFIEAEQVDALRSFLTEKLKNIHEKEKTQYTMICTWLCELFMDKLNELDMDERSQGQKENVIYEFHTFLEENKDHLDPPTTKQILASHARLDELLYYSGLIKDYETLITFNLHKQRWDDALKVLVSQTDTNLYYKYAPILMEHNAEKTVSVLMKKSDLIPRHLIPALIRYEVTNESLKNPPVRSSSPSIEHQGIRYLNHVVTKCGNKDRAIHNYLLSLYTKYHDESALISFLSQNDASYDLHYALGLCKEHNKMQASVIILSKMKLYKEALEQALLVGNIEMAKSIADKPQSDPNIPSDEDKDELRKNLWLIIARHVVEKDKNIKKAMEYLKDTDLLKIEDVLPFFPDFELIDDFKDAIIAALQEYNRHLDSLKNEMKETTKSAELIREDIKSLRNNFVHIEANDKCELCKFPILSNSFYLFPCGHTFHCHCLQDEMKKHLSSELKLQLEHSLQRLDAIDNPNHLQTTEDNFLNDSFFSGAGNIISNIAHMNDDKSDNTSHRSANVDKMQLRDIIDSLVASECFLCGKITIQSIDVPFDDEI
uniref:Uncharacterized protein n=1 Tax=Arcella intermedia TaxID=1963864 RepID=A0A6B2KX76_9EUKA